MESIKKYLAEFIGTCVLVVFGCGTAIVCQCSTENYAGYLLTALAFGLVIVAMAYSVGNVSGCHINPAVSLAMLINGKLSVKDFIGYVVSQCLGATAGAVTLLLFLGKNCGFGANGLYNGSIWLSLGIEMVLTCVFVFAILGVTSKENFGSAAGLVIGLTLTLVHILGIAFTGTSVNPARSFGPALLKAIAGGELDALKSLWVFIVGPLVGAAVAAIAHKFLNSAKKA